VETPPPWCEWTVTPTRLPKTDPRCTRTRGCGTRTWRLRAAPATRAPPPPTQRGATLPDRWCTPRGGPRRCQAATRPSCRGEQATPRRASNARPALPPRCASASVGVAAATALPRARLTAADSGCRQRVRAGVSVAFCFRCVWCRGSRVATSSAPRCHRRRHGRPTHGDRNDDGGWLGVANGAWRRLPPTVPRSFRRCAGGPPLPACTFRGVRAPPAAPQSSHSTRPPAAAAADGGSVRRRRGACGRHALPTLPPPATLSVRGVLTPTAAAPSGSVEGTLPPPLPPRPPADAVGGVGEARRVFPSRPSRTARVEKAIASPGRRPTIGRASPAGGRGPLPPDTPRAGLPAPAARGRERPSATGAGGADTGPRRLSACDGRPRDGRSKQPALNRCVRRRYPPWQTGASAGRPVGQSPHRVVSQDAVLLNDALRFLCSYGRLDMADATGGGSGSRPASRRRPV